MVGDNRKIGSHWGWLRSSNRSYNQVPQEAKYCKYYDLKEAHNLLENGNTTIQTMDPWFRVPKSVTISITAGMHQNYICDQSRFTFLNICVLILGHNICSAEKYTKRSSNY